MYKLLRRGSGRMFVFCVVVLSLLLCLYYVSQTQQTPNSGGGSSAALLGPEGARYDATGSRVTTLLTEYSEPPDARISTATCPLVTPRKADIDAQEEFKKFDFQPSWMRSREYWDDSFEARYVELRKDPTRPPLKVILVPHSHTDPGWLKTFEQYFHSSTRGILNNMVTKLQQWPNMTFIWSEVSFLSLWWESAHPTKKMVVKRLVKEGRLEMTTGGWVMTDEASSHIYAMLDQLIEEEEMRNIDDKEQGMGGLITRRLNRDKFSLLGENTEMIERCLPCHSSTATRRVALQGFSSVEEGRGEGCRGLGMI